MRKVEAFIEIFVHPQTALQAFTDLNHLKKWWGVDRALTDKQEGGLYSLVWNDKKDGPGYVFSGIVKSCQPGRMLEIENIVYVNPEHAILGPMSLVIRFVGNENKTAMHLSQEGFGKGKEWDWYFNTVKESWPKVLLDLKSYLESLG